VRGGRGKRDRTAIAAFVLADAFLEKFGGDSMAEIERIIKLSQADKISSLTVFLNETGSFRATP